MKTERRSALKKLLTSIGGVMGLGLVANATKTSSPVEKVEKEVMDVTNFQEVPLFAGATKLGNLVFIAGRAPIPLRSKSRRIPRSF
jgi:hypothetical protein